MPNQIGQAYGLTVLSPIKPNAVTDVRAFLDAVERAAESPFAKIGGQRPTVHTARWVVLEDVPKEGGHFHTDALASQYLLLDVNLDTDARGLDGFLGDMARAMPEEIKALYANCVGFTGVGDFADYIKKCQLETTFFFVDYAADDRGKVVHVHEALDIQKRFVELAVATQAEAPGAARKQVMSFLEQLSWNLPPGQIVKHAATTPPRELTRQRIELDDVQGNIVRGYKYPFARHLYFRVKDAGVARNGLRTLAGEVDHSGDWGREKPASSFNLAFSWQGLKALGVSDATLDGFPLAFRMGMRARAEILGDTVGESVPSKWEPVWGEGVHVLASVFANDKNVLEDDVKWAREAFIGAELVGQQDTELLRDPDGSFSRREHFGFTDGFGTMDVESPGLDSTPGSGKLDGSGHWTGLAPGELLFGYRDEADEYPDTPNPPDLVRNGTFLVFRKLRENVMAFRDYLREHGKRYGDEELLAAKMVGRFRDGTPLALSDKPDAAIVNDPHRNNDFRYADDPDGARCPITAHVRRARPRDALGFDGKVTDRRRLQRRGMPYGPPLPDDATGDDGVERGIVFAAYNIDIERQFEFIQQHWLNYGNTFRQGNDKDVLSGNNDGTGKAVIQATADRPPYVCTSLPAFIDTRGGEYFFVPGITGLRMLTDVE